MNRFLVMFVALFAIALSFGGCAEADHPRNEEGGRLWSLAEVIEESAEDGAGVGAQDTCEDCCFPYVCTIFCCNQPGGGGDSGGGSGGGSCSTKCGSIAKCQQHGAYCLAFCPGSCGPR